jgi:hypothetical protein
MNLTVESIEILSFSQESWIYKSIRLRHGNSFDCGLFDRQHINYQNCLLIKFYTLHGDNLRNIVGCVRR